jgi:hypothetical protein
MEWKSALIADLGGKNQISAQQLALVEIATRTRLYIDHLDAFLMSQGSLVNAKRKAVLPVLRERQALADSLARILGQLGLERRPNKIPDLTTYLAQRYGGRNELTSPESEQTNEGTTAPQERTK